LFDFLGGVTGNGLEKILKILMKLILSNPYPLKKPLKWY
jgi:hypothetical protein